MAMLRLSVRDEEFLMIGDDVKIVFLGSSGGQTRIMIDAPKDVNIVRSKAIEKRIQDPELLATIPKYYKNPEGTAKKKKIQRRDRTEQITSDTVGQKLANNAES